MATETKDDVFFPLGANSLACMAQIRETQKQGRHALWKFIALNWRMRQVRRHHKSGCEVATMKKALRVLVNDLVVEDVLDLFAGKTVVGRVTSNAYEPLVLRAEYAHGVISAETRAHLETLASVHMTMPWRDFYDLCKDVRGQIDAAIAASPTGGLPASKDIYPRGEGLVTLRQKVSDLYGYN
jgi:hypothetical protein